MPRKPEKDEYAVTRQDYRNVFSTASGRRVLSHLLVDLGFWDESETEEDAARRNVAVRILRNMGVIDPARVAPAADALIDVALTPKEGGNHG